MVRGMTALLVVFFAAVSASQAQLTQSLVVQSDLNRDGSLGVGELVSLFMAHDPEFQKATAQGFTFNVRRRWAEDWAIDVATASPPATTVPVRDALRVIAGLPSRAQKLYVLAVAAERPRQGALLWKSFQVRRKLEDLYDPRGWSEMRPAIFSYMRDEEAEDRDQFTFLGAVQFFSVPWQSGSRNFFNFSPAVEMEILGAKPSNETSITFGSPIIWKTVRRSKVLSSSILSLSPRFGTDRSFDRDVREIALGWTFASEVIRSRFTTLKMANDKPVLAFSWSPTVEVSTGKIEDAGGNEKLEALGVGKSYTRALIGLNMSLAPRQLSQKLVLTIDYALRYDFDESWTRDFLSVGIAGDVTKKGTVQLTIVYRRGRKPPAFEDIDQFLFALGVLKN